MKWIIRAVVYAALIGAGIWLWIYFHPTPQEAIRRQLNQLAEAASFEGAESVIRAGIAASQVGSFFGNEVRMNIEPSGVFAEETTRPEIVQSVAFFRTRGGMRSLQVKFFDPVITLGANNDRAIVELTVNAETSGDRHLLVQELKLSMKLVDKNWLIVRVETVKTLN